MNLQEFPVRLKEDIEDQSLSILKKINDDIIVIGGWGVRSHLGKHHGRYTLDIDGVCEKQGLEVVCEKLKDAGLNVTKQAWGVKFFQSYVPTVEVPLDIEKEVGEVELRIEISGPRISEAYSSHFFEFSLEKFDQKEIFFHSSDESVGVRVPSVEVLTANKLGLPTDYKNVFDALMLLQRCDIEEVIKKILSSDDWGGLVIRRMPKIIGRLKDKTDLVNMLLVSRGVDVAKQIDILRDIEKSIR